MLTGRPRTQAVAVEWRGVRILSKLEHEAFEEAGADGALAVSGYGINVKSFHEVLACLREDGFRGSRLAV